MRHMDMSRCGRCGATDKPTTVSYFNTDVICSGGPDSCHAKEKAHPRYEEARRIETEAVKRGDYNFPGIGKPADL